MLHRQRKMTKGRYFSIHRVMANEDRKKTQTNKQTKELLFVEARRTGNDDSSYILFRFVFIMSGTAFSSTIF